MSPLSSSNLGRAKHPQEADPGSLGELIAQRISAHPNERISFVDYMDWALYEPDYGYYAANAAQIGVKGDFVTAPHLGADFGELLAVQFIQMWEILDRPVPFTLMEMGAGQGLIALDVLRYLDKCAQTDADYAEFQAALEYVIVEKAVALIAEQKRHLKSFCDDPQKLRWMTLADMPSQSITGCIFSNELVDALPVHQIVMEGGELREVYVRVKENGDIADPDSHSAVVFQEQYDQPSTSKLSPYLDWMGIDRTQLPDGYRSEINLAALDWLNEATEKLQQGYVLTIDYGYSAEQYYSPARQQGTLQCYRRHGSHSNPYLYVGQQDITSHVNFSALEQHGQTLGLETLGRTQQGLFLMALGLGERLVTNNSTADLNQLSEVLRRREAIHALINPLGLGGFQVLIQSLNIAENKHKPLKGLQIM